MTCSNPNCNQDREHKMAVIARNVDGRATVWCDPCIAPLIKALNDAGIRTKASCCGHGRLPGLIMLADGRELMILDRPGQRERAYAMFPGTINDERPA